MATTTPRQEGLDLDRRHIWASVRLWMEVDNYKYLQRGGRRRRYWDLFETLLQLFALGLKACGLYRQGVKNAEDIKLRQLELPIAGLPGAFAGYTILHITDPHFDSLPGTAETIASIAAAQSCDLCVLTGDYRVAIHGDYRQILEPLALVAGALRCRDGIFATLGNHDTVLMVDAFEELGIRVLANETVTIKRDGQQLHLTGVDDPHYYFTPMAVEALDLAPQGTKIALVHSPELYDRAAANGYSLYLAGHTHGGQICLPGGKPIICHLSNGRHLAKGLWREGSMYGYTSNGAGTSGLPVRFNTTGEITLITLQMA